MKNYEILSKEDIIELFRAKGCEACGRQGVQDFCNRTWNPWRSCAQIISGWLEEEAGPGTATANGHGATTSQKPAPVEK